MRHCASVHVHAMYGSPFDVVVVIDDDDSEGIITASASAVID